MHLLRIFSEVQNKTIVEVMEPHKDVLADMIPPKKHLLRHQSVNAQIGLMEGNTFCTTLTPRLFTIGKTIVLIFFCTKYMTYFIIFLAIIHFSALSLNMAIYQ